ncbi:hypothetical protein B0O99DRAFT_595379 [Bisporella sp. PMI_857]|nr:hypothetical protein B0O99DRAFT_595379 [Bisporella sp. PMI_857]
MTMIGPTLAAHVGKNETRIVWYAAPNERGTMDILWSCLSTIFICTWTVSHPAIFPRHRKRRKLRWTLAGVLIPEGVAISAMSGYLNVRRFTNYNVKNNPGWRMEHSYIAFMDGWQIWSETLAREKILTPSEVCWLLSQHCIDMDKIPSHHEILDKSKSNPFLKLVAICQSGWLVVQVLSRVITHLPVSVLEVATTEYVVCAFFTYMFYLSKPQDVECVMRLECKPLNPTQMIAFNSVTESFEPWMENPVGSWLTTYWARSSFVLWMAAVFTAIHATVIMVSIIQHV